MALSRTKLTARGAGALAGALAVFLFAFYTTNILLFVLGVFLLGVVLAGLFSFSLATWGFGPDAFLLQRVESSSLVAVGGAGLVSLRVTSQLGRSFYAELFDTHSDRLTLLEGDAHLLTWWTGGESLTLSYVVSPSLRGLFDVGPTTVVAHDTLGLAFKTASLQSRWSIEAIIQPALLPLGHPVRLSSTVVGQTSLSVRGAGSDFRGLREYESQDELRSIAWTRSTQGTLYVRENDRESQQDLLVLLDVGRGMAMGPAYEDALEQAVEAAARSLRAAFDEGGRGGVVVFGQRVLSFVPAGRGSSHEFRVFRALTAAQLRPPPSSLSTALAYVRPRLERPTTLLAFSSLAGDLTRIATTAAGLRPAGHRVYALLPDVGRMYDELDDVTEQTAFRMVIEPELRRAKLAAETLEQAGVSVEFFGRNDAVDAVARLYARRPNFPGFG